MEGQSEYKSEKTDTKNIDRGDKQSIYIEREAPKRNANTTMLMVMAMILLLGLAALLIFKANKRDDTAQRQKAFLAGNPEQLETIQKQQAISASARQLVNNAQNIQAHIESLVAKISEIEQHNRTLLADNQGKIATIEQQGAVNVQLRQQLAELRSQAANAGNYKMQAEQARKMLQERDNLVSQLSQRPTAESVAALKTSYEQTLTELNLLKQKMVNMVDSSELSSLRDKVAILERQNQTLRSKLQVLRTQADFSKLFVKAVDQLPADASTLYGELRGLEGVHPVDLPRAYTRIGETLNAAVIQEVAFATGSYAVGYTDEQKIQLALNDAGPNDYFLVVGYASKIGGADGNQKLSANRATAVASIVNTLKEANQDVRAVYLGQTSRFSSNAKDNQRCEIWRIRR